jgi:hypothetical protein
MSENSPRPVAVEHRTSDESNEFLGLDSACECAYCETEWMEDGYIRNYCPGCGVKL